MLVPGIIAVFKVISLKTGGGELHKPCLLQWFFFVVLIFLSLTKKISAFYNTRGLLRVVTVPYAKAESHSVTLIMCLKT